MFKPSPKFWILVKYGLLVLVALGFLFTYSATVPRKKEETDVLDLYWDNFTFLEDYTVATESVLDSNAAECLGLVRNASEENSNSTGHSSEDRNTRQKNALHILDTFTKFLASLDIKTVIIEPSILFCMLRSSTRTLLENRGLNMSSYIRSRQVITLGVLKETIERLQEKAVVEKLQTSGFRVEFVETPLADWMKNNKIRQTHVPPLYISHIFLRKKDCTIHLLVLHERKTFLWHAASDDSELEFLQNDSAYERFGFVSLDILSQTLRHYHVPSLPHHFLLQTKTSTFLECNSSGPVNAPSDHPSAHPSLSVEKFNRRTVLALRMLKSLLHPLLIDFWIWSGTMLGWYRQCDVIPYTTDVDFAAWAKDVDNLNLIIQLLLSNEHLIIKERMGLVEEALEFQLNSHNLRVDLFFMYQIENGTWYSGHKPQSGYYFRYYHPNFTICSAELLGEKVNVPCETEEVIVAEYGRGWRQPVSSWDYETSIKNRGPNIYWNKDKLKDSYQNY